MVGRNFILLLFQLFNVAIPITLYGQVVHDSMENLMENEHYDKVIEYGRKNINNVNK